jgi:hypothetical protein
MRAVHRDRERGRAGRGGPRRKRRYRPFCDRDNWGRIRAVYTRRRRCGYGRSQRSARAGIRAPGCHSEGRRRIRRARRRAAHRRRPLFPRGAPASCPARSDRAASFPGSDVRIPPGRAPARGSSMRWPGQAPRVLSVKHRTMLLGCVPGALAGPETAFRMVGRPPASLQMRCRTFFALRCRIRGEEARPAGAAVVSEARLVLGGPRFGPAWSGR